MDQGESSLRGWLVSLLLLMLILSPAASADEKMVLVLHSYHPEMVWVTDISAGIGEVLGASTDPIQIRTEYMDTKRYESPAYLDQLAAMYRYKYHDDPPDCIIVADDAGLRFLLDYREELFPGIPIVFCGINHYDPLLIEGHSGITGVVEGVNIHDTLLLIRTLHPEMKRLVVINEESITGSQTLKTFHEVRSLIPGSVAVEYIEGESIPGIGDRVGSYGEGDVILLLALTNDPDGLAFIPHDRVGSYIAARTEAPVYGIFEYYLGDGVIGGVFFTGRDQGRIAADLARQILDGAHPDDLPIIEEVETKGIVDHRALVAHRIAPEQLPPGTAIINRPPPIVEIPMYILIILLIGGVFLVTIVLMKEAELQKQRGMEAELREREELYRGITERSFDPIVTIDPDRRVTYLSPSFQRVAGMTVPPAAGILLLEFIPDDDRERVSRAFDAILLGEKIEALTFPLLREDGTKAIIEATFFPMYKGGEIIGIQGLLRDITERMELISQQKEAFRQIEENITQLAILGDHIRNPLQVIEGYTILGNGEYAEEISDQVRRINDIVSRLDQGWIESENVRGFLKRHYAIDSDHEDEKH